MGIENFPTDYVSFPNGDWAWLENYSDSIRGFPKTSENKITCVLTVFEEDRPWFCEAWKAIKDRLGIR